MPEKLDPELKEKFIKQFGRGRNDFNKYRLDAYDPERGTAHLVDEAGRADQVVDYALVESQQTKTIARREVQAIGFGSNRSLLSAEVSYTAGGLRTKYELHYELRSDTNEPDYATISVDYITDEVTSTGVDLTDGSYHEAGKLTRVYIAFGDPDSLAKYYEEQRRRAFGSLVFNCFPSRPGVHLEQEEDQPGWVLKDGSFFGEELARIGLNETVSPESVNPYSYKITPQAQQLEFNRTCTVCDGEWNFFFPTQMDLQSLDTMLRGERWVETITDFPFTLNIKDGSITPCPSDVQGDDELDEVEEDDLGRFPIRCFLPAVFDGSNQEVTPSEGSRNTTERKLPTTSDEVEKMVKDGGLDELLNGLVIFPPGTFS